MPYTESKLAPKKTYSISNEQMLNIIEKLPSLKDNNKNTEYIYTAHTSNDIITDGSGEVISKSKDIPAGRINIHFSYDFVMDRWFLNDNKISVVNRMR